MTDVLTTRGNLDTDLHAGRTPGQHKSREGGEASTRQVLPANQEKLGERHEQTVPLSPKKP